MFIQRKTEIVVKNYVKYVESNIYNMNTEVTQTKDSVQEEVLLFVVDDDYMYCKAIENYFNGNSNYRIFSFNTGEKCMEHLPVFSPEIIILDYRLNDVNPSAMNGLQVLQEIKKINAEIKIVMLSASESIEVATNSIKYGAYDYIVKNQSAFIRLENILEIIVKDIEFGKLKKKRERQLKDILLIGMILIVLFVISSFALPKEMDWLNVPITMFCLIYILFYIKAVKQKNFAS